MLVKLIPLAAVLLLFSSTSWAEAVILNIGETYRVPTPANHQIWIQNRQVLKVVPQGRNILLIGNREGPTAAVIGGKHLQIQVVLPNKKHLFAQFEKAARKMLGLKIRFHEQQVDVQGRLLLWQDWETLAKLSRDLEVPYTMSATIPQVLQVKMQNLWKSQWDLAGLAPLPVQFTGKLRARSSAKSEVFEKYREILGPYGVSLEKDMAALNLAPVVQVQITVAEVNRDFSSILGVRWPESYQAALIKDYDFQALEHQGQGKVLASPRLLCLSGKEAEFLAGGEFPIKIMNARVHEVVWKKYGVMLKVRPKADSSGRMSIALDVEVSTLFGAKEVDGVPGLLTNRISSHFDLSKPQTIALSGLIKNEESKSSDGLPYLSRLPILGSLFSSKKFRENRTELVIFVRPSIMKEEPYPSAVTRDTAQSNHIGDIQND